MSLPSGKLLITGADGFVGKHFIALLRARHAGADWVGLAADVTDREAVLAEIRHVQPSACLHLAAIASVAEARRDADLVWRVNLGGTLNLARAVLAEAPGCHFLHVSTADAYGLSFAAGHSLDETAPLAPINAYGASKAAADLAIGAMAAEGLRAVRLRPFNHTGAGQSDAFVVAAFARQAARIAAGLQPATLKVGDLTPRRDFLDVHDVCTAYLACLERADGIPPGTIMNLASGQARRIADVLTDILALAGVSPAIEPDPCRLRPSDIPLACGDGARARLLLGWAPTISWEQTLRAVVEDWRGRCSVPTA